ncbi:peroxiredoxin [Reinekea marina]|uniref:thioredoxin-dependent peroxiredoxin n=1 Tax=Reinekea marina TaxID=1310421 RepID=A0ABV7WQM5_9GAMM|nr:peroxiredoxin [Reinekea marina]MDN3650261.1 peroxiredoxin [Reinekea marina]
MVQEGQPVPDFIVPATSNKNIQLKALRGYKVLLYFYPKDNTPGCTIENQDFAANYPRFKAKNILVFGVSRDSLEKHEAFKDQQSLPFELISDHDGKLCELFNVLREKELFGTKIMSVSRSTFLINEEGVLEQAWRDVEVREHVHKVLESIESGTKSRTGTH